MKRRLLIAMWVAGVVAVAFDGGDHLGLVGQMLLLNLHHLVH